MMEYIPNWLVQRIFLTPNRTALVFEEKSWTFHELHTVVKEFVGKIARILEKQTARVAILMKNRPETVFTIHALQQLGIETVFLNNRLTPAELYFQIEDSETTILIYDGAFVQTAKELQRKNPNVKIVSLEKLKTLSNETVEIRKEFFLNDVCSIMYTSGTTGKPKGVLQTYGNHWWSAIGSSLNLGLHENDAWLCAVPLFHISGLSILMRSVIYGIPVYLLEQFDEHKANQLLQSGNVTIMSVVSVMLGRMIQALKDKRYHKNFRCMLLGGGPAPRPLLETCVEKGIPVFQTYGMTETSSQIVTLSPEDSLKKLGSAGKPLFPSQIRIVDSDGQPLPAKEVGEIQLKGPNVTPGYLNRPEANKASFYQGWFKSGDLGYLDEEGFLYVLDRRSDLIISGGENIYPAEIEEVLLAHEAIIDAGVTGIEDETWGQVPYAFIVTKEDIEEERIKHFCSLYLASYKIPKRIIKVKELPRNASNKLLRRELHQFLKGEFSND